MLCVTVGSLKDITNICFFQFCTWMRVIWVFVLFVYSFEQWMFQKTKQKRMSVKYHLPTPTLNVLPCDNLRRGGLVNIKKQHLWMQVAWSYTPFFLFFSFFFKTVKTHISIMSPALLQLWYHPPLLMENPCSPQKLWQRWLLRPWCLCRRGSVACRLSWKSTMKCRLTLIGGKGAMLPFTDLSR